MNMICDHEKSRGVDRWMESLKRNHNQQSNEYNSYPNKQPTYTLIRYLFISVTYQSWYECHVVFLIKMKNYRHILYKIEVIVKTGHLFKPINILSSLIT